MRFMNGQDPMGDVDMRTMFPQLVYLSIKTNLPIRPADPTCLHIQVYAPIEIDDLARYASPRRSVHYERDILYPRPTRIQLLQDMKALVVRRGGGLLFSRLADESRSERLMRIGKPCDWAGPETSQVKEPSLSLHFEDTLSATAAIPTLDALLQVIRKASGFIDEGRMSIFGGELTDEGDAADTPVYIKSNVNILSALLSRGDPLTSVSGSVMCSLISTSLRVETVFLHPACCSGIRQRQDCRSDPDHGSICRQRRKFLSA